MAPVRDIAEGGAHPVQHAHRGMRVVDPRRQRSHRDLHQLAYRELQVDAADPLTTERSSPDGSPALRRRPSAQPARWRRLERRNRPVAPVAEARSRWRQRPSRLS